MNHCPTCKGTGKVNVNFSTFGSALIEVCEIDSILV